MDKKTILTAALALKTSTLATFDANTTKLATLLTEKTKAETAFTKQAEHLEYQDDLLASTKATYIGASGSEATPGDGSAAKNDDTPIANYNEAVNALVTPQGNWSTKVSDVAALLILKDAAAKTLTDVTALETAVDTTLGNVDGVTGTGLYKDKKTADTAITDWHAASDKYDDKAALWVTAATLAIDGM